jgi:transcriptional regulator with XRE-family HTH domain
VNEKLLQIAARIRELREILGVSPEAVAARVGVTPEAYAQYERGALDIPISILYEIADALQTDLTVLLTGEAPRMDTYTLVRAGRGIRVERFPGYQYWSLAFNFKRRDMEPLLVELSPEDEAAPLVAHGGQEFNYVLEGRMRLTLGKNAYELDAGDSVYFDPHLPHGQQAVGGAAKFLTVIKREE